MVVFIPTFVIQKNYWILKKEKKIVLQGRDTSNINAKFENSSKFYWFISKTMVH